MIKPVYTVINAFDNMSKNYFKGATPKIFPNGTKVKFDWYKDSQVVYKTVERKNGTLITTFWHYLLGKDSRISYIDKVSTYERNDRGYINHYFQPFKAGRKVEVEFKESIFRSFKGETSSKNLTKDADLSAMSPKEITQIDQIKEKIKLIRNPDKD